MNANELINSSKDIQEKWLKETKVNFKVDYEYVGCFISEEDEEMNETGKICTYTKLDYKGEVVYAFFTGYSNYFDGYLNPVLFGIYKSIEDGKELVSKLDNFAM